MIVTSMADDVGPFCLAFFAGVGGWGGGGVAMVLTSSVYVSVWSHHDCYKYSYRCRTVWFALFPISPCVAIVFTSSMYVNVWSHHDCHK